MPWNLPVELLTIVLEYIHYDGCYVDERTLIAASLVCRDWTLPAQTLLLREACVMGRKRLNSLKEQISGTTPKSVALGGAIRVLRICPDREYRINSDLSKPSGKVLVLGKSEIPFGVGLDDIAEVLSSCHAIEELDWRRSRDKTLCIGRALCSPNIAAFFQILQVTSLRVLRLRFADSNLVCALLNLLPSLHALEVEHHIPSEEPPIYPLRRTSYPQCKCALRELRWKSVVHPGLLPWILSNSSSSLERLTLNLLPSYIADTVYAADVFSFIYSAPIAARIRSFCFGFDPRWSGDISAFTALEELEIESLTPLTAAELIRTCSPTLRHLVYGPGLFEDPGDADVLLPVVDALSSHLRMLTVKYVPPEECTLLRATCVAHGVKFATLSQEIGRYPGEIPPIYPAQRYGPHVRLCNDPPRPPSDLDYSPGRDE